MGTLKERYAAARTLDDFIEGARQNRELWLSMRKRARVPEDLAEHFRALTGRWHLLVLLEDWCGDAVNTIPVLARLAETVTTLDLRVLERDANPDLMEAHLSGSARAIPVVILLDEEYREVGWWGSRPRELQAWVDSPEGSALSKEERYREVRRWYARDRGRTTLEEIAGLLRSATLERAA